MFRVTIDIKRTLGALGAAFFLMIPNAAEAQTQGDDPSNINGAFGNCEGAAGERVDNGFSSDSYLAGTALENTCFLFTLPGSGWKNLENSLWGVSLGHSDLFDFAFGVDNEQKTWGLRLNWNHGNKANLLEARGSTEGCSLYLKFKGIGAINFPLGFAGNEGCAGDGYKAKLPCTKDQVDKDDGSILAGQNCYKIGENAAPGQGNTQTLADAGSNPDLTTEEKGALRATEQATYINQRYATEIAKALIKNTPGDGALGHSASIVSLNISQDFFGGTELGQAHKVARLSHSGRIELQTKIEYTAAQYDANVSNHAVTMANNLALPMGKGKLKLSIPLTYQKLGSNTGIGGSVGLAYTREVLRNKKFAWSMTPSVRYIANKVKESDNSGSFSSFGLTSDVSFAAADVKFNVANSVNYTSALDFGFMENADVYDYKGLTLTNGISAAKQLGEKLAASVFYVDTRNVGAEFYETYKGELGVAANLAEVADTSVSGLVGSQSYGLKGSVKFSF